MKGLHINQVIIIFVVSIITNSMNNEKQKEWLKDIQMKKMEVKSQLKKLSFLLEQNIIFKEEMDALLDRLRMLEELENEIRKMK
ncbi:MAG: hypothetical protein LBS88_00800 [Tannerellaceae bacterium]|nr:hypothetical protein [Tannerellaceae bacterium]